MAVFRRANDRTKTYKNDTHSLVAYANPHESFVTYVHGKDQLFDTRLRGKDGQIKSTPYVASKVTSIVMTTGVSLSTDAVNLAMRNNVDLIFVEQNGLPMGRVWYSKLGSTTKIRKAQLEASLFAVGVR